MPSTLAVFLLVAMLSTDDKTSPIGNEPEPMVLVLGEDAYVRRFEPLDAATFGEDGRRRLDYEFAKADRDGLVEAEG